MNFKHIPNWWEKNLTCARCGERRSVKYEMNGKTYCNGCVLLESLMPDESTVYGNDCWTGRCEM